MRIIRHLPEEIKTLVASIEGLTERQRDALREKILGFGIAEYRLGYENSISDTIEQCKTLLKQQF